jgi:hypothetical protein
MAEMLTLMNSFIEDNELTTKSSCVYFNMFAYCQIKAGHHRQSVKYILLSLRILTLVVKVIRIGWDQEPPIFLPS